MCGSLSSYSGTSAIVPGDSATIIIWFAYSKGGDIRYGWSRSPTALRTDGSHALPGVDGSMRLSAGVQAVTAAGMGQVATAEGRGQEATEEGRGTPV
ncbi:MAG: hypothetical protein ACOCYQ_02650, partial [Alkalispirochaeta sp.]